MNSPNEKRKVPFPVNRVVASLCVVAASALALLLPSTQAGQGTTSDFGATDPDSATVTLDQLGLAGTNMMSLGSLTDPQLEAFLNILNATPKISEPDLPKNGTFWSLGHYGEPPFPGDLSGSPAWQLGDGSFLLDDKGVNANVLTKGSRVSRTSKDSSGVEAMVDSPPSFTNTSTNDVATNWANVKFAGMFNTNLLWLQATNILNGTVYANLFNPTDTVYAIWSTTNLLAPISLWNVETEVFPTSTICAPFTVATSGRQTLFLKAQDWTSITNSGNSTPSWWFWEYFGTTGLSDTNQDSQGRTLLSDYENGLDPNIISFTLAATNFFVNQATVPLQINLTAGTPSYYAVLVNDTNQADANWYAFSGTNLTVFLGYTDGVYQVTVGLRGRPATATQTWESPNLPFTLDRVPPTITVTNLPTLTGSRPYIDPAGFLTKSISSMTFFLTNSHGTVSSGQGMVLAQGCNPTDMSHITNTFQCFDLALTLGTNFIGIQAVDWAGNTSLLNFSYVFNTNGDTTPPAITILWPQNGTQVSGNPLTVRGFLDDDTATVVAVVKNSTGGTNIVAGLVERGGKFWLQNLSHLSGTNTVLVIATDAAGNSATTNLTLIQTGVTLTMNSVDDSQLNQSVVSVGGAISATSYAVWVNGVQGTNNGDGTWTANNVPVTSSGTASFDIAAYPPANAPTANSWTNFSTALSSYQNPVQTNSIQTTASQDKSAIVYVQNIFLSYTLTLGVQSNQGTENDTEGIGWTQGKGGNLTDYDDWLLNPSHYGTNTTLKSWPKDPGYSPSLAGNYDYLATDNVHGIDLSINTNEVDYPLDLFNSIQHCAVNVVYTDLTGYQFPPKINEGFQTVVNLFTGGKALRNSQSLFILNQGLTWVGRAGYDGEEFDPVGDVPPTDITLAALGVEDPNSNVYVILNNGQNETITARADYSNYYGSTPTFQKNQLLHGVTCIATGDTNLDRTTLGIGEEVSLYGMPDETVWSLSGGGSLSETNGNSTFYTAPMSPTSATIYATYKSKVLSVTFSIIPPNSIIPLSYEDLNTNLADPLGTFMGENVIYTDIICPTNVSFYNVAFRELQLASTNILWPNGTNSLVNFHMATNGGAFGTCDNQFPDHIAFPDQPTRYLYNGSNYVNLTFSSSWPDQYLNASNNWVSFSTITLTVAFRGTDKKCQATYIGMPTTWLGPYDQ